MVGLPSERRPRHRYSYAEYLAYERDSGLEHEFEDGEIEGDPAEPDGPTIRLASGATLDLASLYADLPA